MDFWIEELEKLMKENNMVVHLLTKYVDDVVVVCDKLELGSRFKGGRIVIEAEDVANDVREGRTMEDVTFKVQNEMANSILSFLEFTGEYAMEGRPIPCLDTEVWVGEPTNDGPWYEMEDRAKELIPGRPTTAPVRQVIYRFYKKPMASRLTMLARSALQNNSKVATASAEITRCLKRTSTALGMRENEVVLMRYMDELAGMGFGTEWRSRVLRSALLGYRRILYNETVGKTRRNRLSACTAIKRRVQKLCGSNTWFKQSSNEDVQECKKRTPKFQVGGEKPTESIMFIPYTEGSTFKKSLQEAECHLAGYGTIRYIETTGRTLESSLVVKDPWSGSCHRDNCFPCISGRTGQCQKQNVTYRIDCQLCKLEGKVATYFGETARTMYDRGSEHLSGLVSGNPDNVLVQHMEEEHQGTEPEFTMKLVKSHRSPLYRQVHEGVLIDQFQGDMSMNRKGEWGSNVPETLEVVNRNGDIVTGVKRARTTDNEGDNPSRKKVSTNKESTESSTNTEIIE